MKISAMLVHFRRMLRLKFFVKIRDNFSLREIAERKDLRIQWIVLIEYKQRFLLMFLGVGVGRLHSFIKAFDDFSQIHPWEERLESTPFFQPLTKWSPLVIKSCHSTKKNQHFFYWKFEANWLLLSVADSRLNIPGHAVIQWLHRWMLFTWQMYFVSINFN